MFTPVPLHPHTEFYYYPGHSFSPLHYLSADLLPSDPTPLAFYALDTSRGRIRLLVVLLKYTEDDARLKDMRRSLYPGAVLKLPSASYHREQATSDNDDGNSNDQNMTADVLFVKMKFRYAGPRDENEDGDGGKGWWRTGKEWGEYVDESVEREDFLTDIMKRIDDFVELMERPAQYE